MGNKYCCDDCGKELGEYDNIANQLDMTGKAYCGICLPKHLSSDLTIYSFVKKENSLVSPLPDPIPNNSKPVWEMVIEDMKARDNFGRQRYGTPLQIGNGRNFLIDAYQEALDLVVYLRGIIEQEKDSPAEYIWECPKCHESFEDDGKAHINGILCPSCREKNSGGLVGVLQKRRIS